jgi:hypothetical protein
MNRLKLLALAGLSMLALSACTVNKNEAAKDPVTAAKDLSVAIRDNDFDRFSHIMVPPDLYAKLEDRYKEKQKNSPAPSAEDNKQFSDNVAKFTAPDAEDKLFAEIQPKLAEMGPRIPMMVGVVSGMAGQSIAQNDKLSKAEKDQANAVLTAITKWATTAPLADPDKAKQAIKVIVGAARDLKLTTLDDAQKLSFPEVMQKAGIVVGGLRNTLTVYGFDTDKMLDSVKTEKKSEDGDKAVVTVSYSLLDTPVSVDVDMIQRDGRWYSADLVKSVEDSLAKPADAVAPPAAGPAMAPAGTPAPDAAAPAPGSAPAGSAPAMTAPSPSGQPSAPLAAPADNASSPASAPSNGGG